LKFGEKMYFAIFATRGDVSLEKCKQIVEDIVEICDMKKGDLKAACWKITPLGAEPIGESFTYVQPILTSMIACDQWEELHGAWWFVASCSVFDFANLYLHLEAKFPKLHSKYFEMSMP
jgi:hypothetical protein